MNELVKKKHWTTANAQTNLRELETTWFGSAAIQQNPCHREFAKLISKADKLTRSRKHVGE